MTGFFYRREIANYHSIKDFSSIFKPDDIVIQQSGICWASRRFRSFFPLYRPHSMQRWWTNLMNKSITSKLTEAKQQQKDVVWKKYSVKAEKTIPTINKNCVEVDIREKNAFTKRKNQSKVYGTWKKTARNSKTIFFTRRRLILRCSFALDSTNILSVICEFRLELLWKCE